MSHAYWHGGAALGVWPIWHTIASRQDRLDHFLSKHAEGYAGEPGGEERARLVESVAKSLHKNSRTAKASWQEYFLQIPDFMGSDGNLLAGLSVLIGDDGQLHAAMSPPPEAERSSRSSRRRRKLETAIFSPPDSRRSETDEDLEIDPPKKLSERFGFLSSAYPWHRELSGTRAYLEKHKLVWSLIAKQYSRIFLEHCEMSVTKKF